VIKFYPFCINYITICCKIKTVHLKINQRTNVYRATKYLQRFHWHKVDNSTSGYPRSSESNSLHLNRYCCHRWPSRTYMRKTTRKSTDLSSDRPLLRRKWRKTRRGSPTVQNAFSIQIGTETKDTIKRVYRSGDDKNTTTYGSNQFTNDVLL